MKEGFVSNTIIKDYKIINDQESVHADICIHQIQPKIFDLGEEFYPEDKEEVILIVGKYPLKEN